MKIIWTQLALFDLEEARQYIMANSPSAAIQTIERIEKSLEALQSFPEMGRRGRVSGTRELVIPETPFIFALSHSKRLNRNPCRHAWRAQMGRSILELRHPRKLTPPSPHPATIMS